MQRNRCLTVGPILAAVLTMIVGVAHADPILWVDWTAATAISAVGTADGVIVNFTGVLSPPAQTSGGTDFWAVSPSTYTSVPEVDNPPLGSDIIRLTGGPGTGTQTLTFSQPVVDPVMAILSLGIRLLPNFAVTYDFDAPFDVLNFGPGFFDPAGIGSLTELAGDVLDGREGHGIIQFDGTFTSISWTIPTAENWHGFQVGIPEVTGAPVPEPATILLLAGGLVATARSRWRGRKRA